MSTIKTLTHSLRAYLADAGSPVSLGHTHQLIAAGRGYYSLAALQASKEPEDLGRSVHWIVDVPKLIDRAAYLNLTIDANTFLASLARASRECHGPYIHGSDTDMADHFVNEVLEAAVHDSGVGREMSDTNCTGPYEAYLEFSGSSIDAPADSDTLFAIDYEGEVQGDQDPDRPYSGHSVNVTAQIRFKIIGKRVFAGPPEIEMIDATLDEGYYSEDVVDALPSLSQLEAIALELGIPVEEHEQLEGAEVDVHTTNADNEIGYLINIEHCTSSPLIDRLRQAHPTQQIWVLGNAFERVSRFE